ncbi:MAG TPA: AAA family ATPase [Gemmata sp.]
MSLSPGDIAWLDDLVEAPDTVSGKVTRVFGGQSPSWTAGRMIVKFREVSFTVKGYVAVGEPVTLRGHWITHTKFGRQFEASEVVYTVPTTPDAVQAWLEAYAADIGAVKARTLVATHGADVFKEATERPDGLAALIRIPVESIKRLAKQWASFADRIAVTGEAVRMGLTAHQAELVYARFKGSALTILKTDPYMLLREIDGFGWKTVDELAQKLGHGPEHPGRLRAAVVAAVADAASDGSTALGADEATGKAADMCDLPVGDHTARFEERAEAAIELKQLARVGPALALPTSAAHEEFIWKTFRTAGERNPHVKPERAAELASRFAHVNGRELDETQRGAVLSAARNRLCFITGGAGSGKTTVAKAIHDMMCDTRTFVSLAAPTGKAADRLSRVIGGRATTIHRLLGYTPAGGWEYHAGNQLPGGALIVDEVSMIDSELFARLLSACGTNTSLVLIGDPNQLPPVGPGAVLRDALEYDLAPVARLGVCHRQAGALKRNCNAILEGRIEPTVPGAEGEPSPWYVHDRLATPEKVLEGVRVLFEKYLSEWGYDAVGDVQFLTAQHKGLLGTGFLNRYCQWLNQTAIGIGVPEPKLGTADTDEDGKKKVPLLPGDKVIQTKNDYDLDVMNGAQGVVKESHPRLVVRFGDRDVVFETEKARTIQLGYCITPHKAQGSEWPCAVVVCPKGHGYMQTRPWLYTACTRARKTCVILGDHEGPRRAAAKADTDRRGTVLGVYAMNPEARPA